jgi:hypothetical protein
MISESSAFVAASGFTVYAIRDKDTGQVQVHLAIAVTDSRSSSLFSFAFPLCPLCPLWLILLRFFAFWLGRAKRKRKQNQPQRTQRKGRKERAGRPGRTRVGAY